MSLPKINPTDWINAHKGTIYDIDGVAGVQCVDLFKIFLKDIGYPNPTRPIGGDGYADQIWYRRDALGYSPYFEYVTGALKEGDIVLWAKGSPECPSSHVAMFVEDSPKGNNRGIFLGSNQEYAHSKGVLSDISCKGALGALRYKGFTNDTKPATKPTTTNSIKWIAENGTATFTKDHINIHKDTPDGEVIKGVQYMSGQSVKYIAKCAYRGHRWVRYVRSSGGYGCVAVSGSEIHGKDPWAIFK